MSMLEEAKKVLAEGRAGPDAYDRDELFDLMVAWMRGEVIMKQVLIAMKLKSEASACCRMLLNLRVLITRGTVTIPTRKSVETPVGK